MKKIFIITLITFTLNFILNAQRLNDIIVNIASINDVEEIMDKDTTYSVFKLNLANETDRNWYLQKGGELLFAFIGGMSFAVHETRENNFYRMVKKHPGIENNTFWNENSWYRKWKLNEDGLPLVGEEWFWGSSRWFVNLTDADHFLQAANHYCIGKSAIVGHIGLKREKWYIYLIESAIVSLVRWVGFDLVYNKYYQSWNN